MSKKKVVHYINQFYAGMGGEDTASVGLSTQDGPVGPGLFLAENLGDDYEVVKTIICGDNTIAEKPEIIIPQIQITSHEIKFDSLEVYDEQKSFFHIFGISVKKQEQIYSLQDLDLTLDVTDLDVVIQQQQ